MSDSTKRNQPESLDDFELVFDYFAHDLDPEQVAMVEKRLRDDKEFRQLAAPMLVAWSTPPEPVEDPLSAEELKEHWDKLTERAGFVHQKKKAMRRRLIIVFATLLASAVAAFLGRHRIQEAWADVRDYQQVTTVNNVVDLPRTHVVLERGASLRRRVRDTTPDMVILKLKGSAHFQVRRRPSTGLVPDLGGIRIETRAGRASTGNAWLDVTQHGDSTIVDVLRHEWSDEPTDLFSHIEMVAASSAAFPLNPVLVKPGQRAIIVIGHPVVIQSMEGRP